MDDFSKRTFDEMVERRIGAARSQIAHSLRQIGHGNPLGAEPEYERSVARMRAKLAEVADSPELDPARLAQEVRTIAEAIETPAGSESGSQRPAVVGPESIIGQTYDFVGVSFLTRGRTAADTVGRVIFRNGAPQGSGFLVAPGILLTNQHVVASAQAAQKFLVQFDYEVDDAGAERSTTEFEIDARFFVSDPQERLDFAAFALGRRISGSRDLSAFGYMPLSPSNDKHMLGEVADIVQHPKGRRKEVVLRENRLVARQDAVLHYIADTQDGSSGSPVFNNEWQVIALHHWGGPGPLAVRSLMSDRSAELNEGVRISSIVADLDEKRRSGAAGADRLAAMLERWSRSRGLPVGAGADRIEAVDTSETIRNRSRRRSMPNRDLDFSDRSGYEPGFLRGHVVPLSDLRHVRHEPARNLDAKRDDDPFELPYHHFSIVMNADRRLAFFTACNIDGRLLRHVDRRTKDVNPNPTPRDLQIERVEGSEGAEAMDNFRPDPRVHDNCQMGREFYEKQRVPGYPDTRSRDRIARMFQKGHIIMRSDPAWGRLDEAVAAESDTFFYTNAAPQFGFFNQGSRDDVPGEKGKLRWRAVETYVLRNALTMRERVCVFAGPIFRDRDANGAKADPMYRGVQVPMEFWKIVVWPQNDAIRAIALLAEQRSVLEKLADGLPEALDTFAERFDAGAERFDEVSELRRVQSFLTSVEHIEALTGIVFADVVRRGDLAQGRDLRALVRDEEGLRGLVRGDGQRMRANGTVAAAAIREPRRRASRVRKSTSAKA